MSTNNPPETSSSQQPTRSLNKQLVLDEDEYTAALSHIIARDFFPSLVHLDATNDYLDAVQSKDPELIARSVRRLEEMSTTPLPGLRTGRSGRKMHPSQTPSQTPFASFPSDTPVPYDQVVGEGEDEDGPAAKRFRYDTALSLDEFQARYTSEDNSSFTQIMDEENRKRRERYGWAWEAQKKVEKERERLVEGRERLLIEGAPAGPGVREKFRIERPEGEVRGLITSGDGKGKEKEKEKEKEENREQADEKAVVLKATSVEEATQAVMAPTRDTRSAGVDGWKFKTRNSLMFIPDADVSPYQPSFKPSSEADKKTEPKIIRHGNTRLPEQDHSTKPSNPSEPPSPTRSRVEAAITGTPYRSKSPTLTDINALVPKLPTPTPEQLGPVAVKQLMTWGTLNATPRVLSRSGDEEPVPEPSTPFHIRGPTTREALSHKLASSASKSLRAKAEMLGLRAPGVGMLRTAGKTKRGDMGPPSWTPRRAEAAGNLTPAAKRLLERSTLGAAAARRVEAQRASAAGGGKDRDLNRVRWTPTPTSGGLMH